MTTEQFAYKTFDLMGTSISFWIDRDAEHRVTSAFSAGETFLRDFDQRLSRFRPDSELCALNADPHETVPISKLMVRFLSAALDAARGSGGLVDPTLVDAVEHAGYRESLAGVQPASLAEALAARPPERAAHPDPAALWRTIHLDLAMQTVTRPPGVRIDSGGCGKGLAADLVAGIWRQLLPPETAFIVDCGGDMRVGGIAADAAPYAIRVDTIPPPPRELTLSLSEGAVATSGIGNRLWLREDGTYAHHLLDPSSGEPAWTGLASVTAVAQTALEAETLAKTALLLGPEGARGVLAERGGVLVTFDGEVEPINPRRAADGLRQDGGDVRG
ncbi:MAG: FAD:protein FMN transferase [Solirubrobacterales bacterium]